MKKLIKKIFWMFGLHLSKFNAINVPAYQTVHALKMHNINIVFDVGANEGQFANELRTHGYKGKIISFEPLPQVYDALVKHAEKDEHWIVHNRCAIGASIGEIDINVAENLASSSILPMLNKHLMAAPHTKYTHKEQVSIITLDSILDQYATLDDNIFVKIDTQGYEWSVLDGASQTLKQSKGVLLELSLVPLYEGQKLWQEIINRLAVIRYMPHAIQPGFTDPITGQTLQVDGLFFRN